MKAFSEQGVFWLLDSPSNRAPGVLNYDPASGITLDLMEEFGEPPGHYIMDEPGYIHYIFGILKTYKGVLLESCLISYGGDDNDYVSSWSASYIYVNEHFSVDIIGVSGELLFDKIIIEIPLLLQWVGVSGLGCEQDLEDPSKVAAWFEKPNEIKASTETGNEVGFDFIGTFQNSSPSEMKLTQTTRFFSTSQNACNWTYMLGHIEAIARLLSVVFDEKVSPSRVMLRQAGEWERERWVEFFFLPNEYAEEIESQEEINRIYNGTFNVLGQMSYPALGGTFNDLGQMSYAALGGMSFVTKWLELADKNRVVLAKLMSCKFGSILYVEDRFYQARSAIEAYWVISERGGHGKQFRPADKLLVDLVKEAGFSDVLGEDPDSWASSVEAHRNGYSSHFQQITQPTDVKKMVQQTDCLYYLTLVLLLKDAGVEDSALDGVRDYVKNRLRYVSGLFIP